MGTKYLIDTNVVIEFLGGKLSITGSNWLQNLVDVHLCNLSIINKIELLGYNGSIDEMQTVQDFVDATNIISLSDVVVDKTIYLRKNYKIKLPDAIIAATALEYNFSLITRDISDFKKIKELICIDANQP